SIPSPGKLASGRELDPDQVTNGPNMCPKILSRPRRHRLLREAMGSVLWLLAALGPDDIRAAPAFSSGPISADGRYVVFSTVKDLLPMDRNNEEDVYRYDRRTGELILVSVDSANAASGDSDSYSPVISADGTVVAFVSNATNLS